MIGAVDFNAIDFVEPLNVPNIIRVPFSEPVTYGYVQTPKESPVGVLDNAVLEVRFNGRRFNLIERLGGKSLRGIAIDVDSGEVVTLDFSDMKIG